MEGGWGIAKEVLREDDSVKSTMAAAAAAFLEVDIVDGPTPALVLVANETLRCKPGDAEDEDDRSVLTAAAAGAPSSSVSLFASLRRSSCGDEERGSGLNV